MSINKMPKALITGSAGFIGSHLVDELLAQGWTVTGVDNFDEFYPRSTKFDNLSAAFSNEGFRLIEADIRDMADLQTSLVGGYDVIVHLAAKAGVRPSIDDPLAYQRTNVIGTQNLLELARLWKCRQFVFASSSSVYGVNPRLPWSEEDKVLLPISPYASTKVSGELLGHVYSHLFDIRFVALRLFTVYGPRQRPDLAIHRFASLLSAGDAIPIFGDGSTRRDYTYVSDIVAGIVSAMSYEGSQYEIFNLGNDNPVRLLDLVGGIAEALNVEPCLKFLPMQSGDVPQTWANIEKARRMLGYSPNTPYRVGLERFAQWLRARNRRAAA